MNRKGHGVIIAVFVAVIGSLVTLNVFFQRTLQREIADQFNKQQLLLASVAASGIQGYIGSAKDEMLTAAELVSRFQVVKEADFALLTKGFFQDIGTVRKGIVFLDSEGRTLYTRGNLAFEGLDGRNSVSMVRKLCAGDAFMKQDTKRVYIVAPVCRSDAPIGAVAVVIDIQDIARQFLGPIKSGLRGYAWMMNDKGDLLHHPTQPDMVGRNLYKTDSSCFKCHKTFDVERKIIEGKGDYFGRHVTPSGEDKVLAFATSSVGDSRWIVAVSAPYSEVILSIKSSMKFYSWLIISIFLVTGVVSVMALFFYRKKVKAQEIERHQEQLQQYARDLEEKVSRRTEELSDEKEKLNTIVGAIKSGIVLFDNHGRIQWINQTMKELAGKDITGMFYKDICSGCIVMDSCKVGEMQTEIVTNLFGRKDRYLQVTAAPIKGAVGEVHGYIRLVQDVTEMKKMEEQMIHSEKLASMGRLTSGIAHEMGNPPTSVFSFVRILKEMEQDEFKKESLETTYFHMKRIADVLKQLSLFSMMPPDEFRPWKVNSLIESSLSLIQYDSRAKDVTIVRDLWPDLPEITTDGNQLSQVIVNIVLNAVDAMPDGGTLTIRSRARDNGIVIDFEDTGVGIPRESLDRIFDPFYTTKEQGTGLGLAVSSSIIKKLKGSLTVESEVNKGSKFTITFPFDKPA